MNFLFLILINFVSEDLLLHDYYRVEVQPKERFDLSGLHKLQPDEKKRWGLKEDFIVINDKSSIIYKGEVVEKILKVSPWIDLRTFVKIKDWDLEDIDSDGEFLFIVNENDGTIIKVDPKGLKPKVEAYFWKNPHKKFKFDSKFGIESLAVSGAEILLGKEMMPLAVFRFDKNGKYLGIDARNEFGSQTALRVRRGNVFILDRENRQIWVESPLGKVKELLSFRGIVDSPKFRYLVKDNLGVAHDEWSTAEALALDTDYFYIGLDNNDLPLKADSKESRGSILVLKRKIP